MSTFSAWYDLDLKNKVVHLTGFTEKISLHLNPIRISAGLPAKINPGATSSVQELGLLDSMTLLSWISVRTWVFSFLSAFVSFE